MALEIGTRIGSYEVTGKLGEGGMGEVYRAHDETLDRDVALKVLSEAFVSDPDRLSRFEREAKVLASLNHPNIGVIYGFEKAGDTQALVLELIEGPTLADRIAQGTLLVEESSAIALQIAEALEAAHEQGIIHRDLKPANVKVRPDGTVKVLDFGLAKAVTADTSGVSGTESPTVSLTGATQMGMVIGTAAYMSPEQAKGKAVDKRTDIWAFGVVLYEMLTGRRLFDASDVSEVLASVLLKDPDFSVIGNDVPQKTQHLLSRCLSKDVKHRLRDIGEARIVFGESYDLPTEKSDFIDNSISTSQKNWLTVPIMTGLVALSSVASVSLAWLLLTSDSQSPAVTRFDVALPRALEMPSLSATSPGPVVELSPDGQTLVWVASRDGVVQLWRRPLDQLEATPIAGTEGASHPFFSPDGDWIGFFAGSQLKKVALVGGPPATLCDVPGANTGADWGDNGRIVYSGENPHTLWQVSDNGGEPEALTVLMEDESAHRWPNVLPGSNAVLFTTISSAGQNTEILSLDTGEREVLFSGSDARYVNTGHLLFARGSALWAVPFDEANRSLAGDVVPLIEGIQIDGGGELEFAVSANGTLAYLEGTNSVQRRIVWVDRDGTEEATSIPFRNYAYPRISPDGTQVALDIRDQQGDIWIWDTGDILTRLTLDDAPDMYAHWTPDSQSVIFSSRRTGPNRIYMKSADGTGTVDEIGDVEGFVNAITPDGSQVLLNASNNIVALGVDSQQIVEPVLSTDFNERNAVISPDGQWIAYESNASGRYEIYVQPFPDIEGGRWQVSTRGGTKATWSRDGRELFFVVDSRLMGSNVSGGSGFSHSSPEIVLDRGYYFALPGRTYDVAPDGRFLMIKSGVQGDGAEVAPGFTLVLNWFEELLERVPVS